MSLIEKAINLKTTSGLLAESKSILELARKLKRTMKKKTKKKYFKTKHGGFDTWSF